MRQSYKIIPIYTADVSGVCSALYELGGMTVMHDPSGCNSTYNTHDEIRWYDQDSMIFISGLTEIDAVMGNDEKLIQDIEEAARELKPKFIALAGSPIPFMNGTDFPAIAEILELDLGIPSFSVPTNGMHDYVYGAGMALAEIAKRIPDEKESIKDLKPGCQYNKGDNEEKTLQERKVEKRNIQKRNIQKIKVQKSVNLLGVTPLDFGPQEHVEAMKKNLEDAGWKVVSVWAMGNTLEDLNRAPEAEVNLVVSSTGLRAAEVLKDRFGIPYVTGTPIKGFMGRLTEALEKKIKVAYLEEEQETYYHHRLKRTCSNEKEVVLIGEPVTMGSLAVAIESKYGIAAKVICPLQETEGLLAPWDEKVRGEEEMEKALKNADIIVADPLYRPVCPKDAKFYELPHIAFSGRIYKKHLPVLADIV